MTAPLYDYPRPLTILYMEDDMHLREDVVDLLKWLYHPIRIIEVANGSEVLPLALAHQPNLIISDMAHPGLWGHLVFEQLRREPQTNPIPHIFLTANARSRFANLLYESDLRPPEAYIEKPFHPMQLYMAIRSVFPFLMTFDEWFTIITSSL